MSDETPIDASDDHANYENRIIGGSADDTLDGTTFHDRIVGWEGNDTIGEGVDEAIGGSGNDLLAGDMAGEEWSLVDGKWVYDASKIATGDGAMFEFDDTIIGGDGDDVVLGNGGDDELHSGSGDDTINAGSGDDISYGGAGDDLLNLEDGDDSAEGGEGADTINAGSGNDVVYGDTNTGSILKDGATGVNPTNLADYAKTGWDVHIDEEEGTTSVTQQVNMVEGNSYSLNFELAANLPAGITSGTVDVVFNGEVVDTVSVSSGLFESYSVKLTGTGGEDEITFVTRPDENEADSNINTDGAIFSYQKTMDILGQDVDVAAFAPGQNGIYQVIDGNLHVFDPVEETYTAADVSTGFKINAIGFNEQDDLIYGIAKGSGVDALGNEIAVKDIVMMDATGAAYKVGTSHYGDYVGDFDNEGNLYTFHTSMDRVTKIDIDNLDANGEPVVETFHFPKGMVTDRIYDIAYNAADNSFYGIAPPKKNGGEGTLVKVDLSNLDEDGQPIVTNTPITGTLFEDGMRSGMVSGAYGAVIIDGDGNIYAGLNRGDHDMDSSTGNEGAIFKINVNAKDGFAYTEFVANAPTTGSNDGAVDPRAIDPFTEVDGTATVMMREPELVPETGGNDDLRGGEGDDLMYGGAGGDTLSGGEGDDTLHGDAGDDKLRGGEGDDQMFGGAGADYMDGGTGDDTLSGDAGADRIYGGEGNDVAYGGSGDDKVITGAGDDVAYGGAGKDFVYGQAGDDHLSGGAGADKIVGGSGADTIEGGEGDDHLWGGNWWKDGDADTFVVSSGSGKDMIHDFEADHDAIDLSSYGIEFGDLDGLVANKGWATEIDLSGLEGGQEGDKLILKSVNPDDLDESNFIL